MEVTYQALLDDLYLKEQDQKFIDYNVIEAIRVNHEIYRTQYENIRNDYWRIRTPEEGVLNFNEVSDLYTMYKPELSKYLEIRFPIDYKGKTFYLDVKRCHDLKDGLSCYPTYLIEYLKSTYSNIWLVKGNKDVIKGEYPHGNYNIMMLKCQKSNEIESFSYFDIVEDPGKRKIDLSKFKK